MDEVERQARERIAIALDLPRLDQAEALLERLAGRVGWFKVGGELFTAAGPAAIAAARHRGRVFLDTKLHDIPHTVAAAVRAAARQGVGLLTLHASGGRAMLAAARAAADEFPPADRPRLLAVTVLTSLDEGALHEVGVAGTLPEHVARLVDLARDAGIDGFVCSPHEARAVRARAGEAAFIVTPGVRTSRDPSDDQRRTASCEEAIRAGSDLLVIGRPVLRAPDPRAEADLAREAVRKALATAAV